MQLWDSSAAGFGRPRPDFALDTRHAKSAGMRFRGRGETYVVGLSQTKSQFCVGRDIVCRGESNRAISITIIALRDDLRNEPLLTRHTHEHLCQHDITHPYCLTRKIISSESAQVESRVKYNREISEEGLTLRELTVSLHFESFYTRWIYMSSIIN